MSTSAQTAPTNTIQHVGMLAAKGLFYVLFGLVFLLTTPGDRSSLFWLFGLLLGLSGLCSIGFGRANQRIEENSRWFVASGLSDLVFSAFIFLHVGSSGMADRFWDVMAFWAILFGFMQGVQAMYPFQATPSNSFLAVPIIRLHLLSVLVAISLFGVLQLQPVDKGWALACSAFLMMVLGGLLLLIAPRLRKARVN